MNINVILSMKKKCQIQIIIMFNEKMIIIWTNFRLLFFLASSTEKYLIKKWTIFRRMLAATDKVRTRLIVG